MKILKNPIKEDRYLNVKIDTYPMEFSPLDSLFYDLNKFNYCIVINDGEKDVLVEYASNKLEALNKHKEYYDRLRLRSKQFFDVKKRKFFYINYKEEEEKLKEIVTIEDKNIFDIFVSDVMSLIVKGANSSLIFYTKREAANYFRAYVFAIFSGLRVKVGQLKYTSSYNELKIPDAKEIKNLIENVEKDIALKFLNSVYKPGEFQDRWQMFIDLIEAKISEYYKEGNRYTSEIPNYVILEAILKEVDERIALTKKPDTKEHKKEGSGEKADWSKRFPLNKPGKFYVDEKCIVCDACAATAPKFFKLNEQHAYVYNQPTTPEEIELCNKALAGCPVGAIGNDGDIMMNLSNSQVSEKPKTKEEKKEEVKKIEEKKEDLAINKEEEIQLLKSLIEKAPIDKLNQIKELLKDLEDTKKEIPKEEIKEEVKAEVNEVKKGQLPATSPDGSKVFPENVPGLFYVDEKCIECDACVTTAPNFFKIENGHAFLYNQPTTDAEIAQCDEAMAGCPVSAINKLQ
ncbi:MAG: hypothetical protein KatS3mg068_1210 [Candidatus Sericytochromatia bacterium]|nr:MAG: hypothetical protein KatS3mg068_1210 [Candidatus Sericytochromatia bacterium]